VSAEQGHELSPHSGYLCASWAVGGYLIPGSVPNQTGEKINVSDEIQPYVVYRILPGGEQMECALWQFKDGQRALALFLSGDAATTFRESAKLGAEWKIFCPAREGLLELLKGCDAAGIGFAVLDPDQEKAKRIFNIHEILAAAGG
jgi:hypothetical protein